MATTGAYDDLLRLLREDSDFRAAMRRELLTAELLEVPQRLTALEQSSAALMEHAKVTNKRLDKIEADIIVIKDDITVMKDDITVMKRDIAATQEDIIVIKDDITVIKNDINGLGESFRREVRAQSIYRGNYAQSSSSRNRVDIAHPFAELQGLDIIDVMQISRNKLKGWLRDNIDLVRSLNLRARALSTFLNPDIVAEVKHVLADDDEEPSFYIVVEASYTADAEDIHKATDHAKIVRAVTGLAAYPIVSAVLLDDRMEPETRSRIYDDIHQFLAANDPDAAFWHRLDSADLRPREPR